MMTPHSKQPKVGEVWAFRPDEYGYDNAGALYYVKEIVDGRVIHYLCDVSPNHPYSESVQDFLNNHVFVF